MKPAPAPINAAVRPQGGVAAVELAIIMCLTAFLLPTIFLFGRVFLQYNVLKQATQDAANYMASIPLAELRNSSKVVAATTRAQQMVTTAVAEAGITPSAALGSIFVYCNVVETCG
ncbi:MAG: TadE family protein, partial [Telluria sp.]